jgi:3-oxoadipate enol-lactonase
MGLSFGGMVAQEVAVSSPERLDRLALLCTSSGGQGGASYPLQNLAAMEPEERTAVSARLLDTRFTDEWLTAHDGDRALATLLTRHFTTDKPEPVRRAEALQLRARTGHDAYERLPRISCPTLVATGRYDGIAPVANGAAIVSQLPNGKLEEFDGGHVFFAQDPSAFPRIIEFLGIR